MDLLVIFDNFYDNTCNFPESFGNITCISMYLVEKVLV